MMFENKIRILENWYLKFEGTLTAFSGGVDSSLVLYLSKGFLPDSTVACISNSESLKREDFQIAKDFCQQYEIPLEIIQTKEIEDKNYNLNPSDRCFYCKSHLYIDLLVVKERYPKYVILNGTNRDDFSDYRPGLKAAAEFKIRSPLAECDLGKDDIRELANYLDLPNWNKPASPCLSSRIPYGKVITTKKLKQVETAEGILNIHGFPEARVRHFGNRASIEVPETLINTLKEKLPQIEHTIKALGFEFCEIDEEGLVSGKLNRQLKLENGRSV
jgi:uncharacterized protein